TPGSKPAAHQDVLPHCSRSIRYLRFIPNTIEVNRPAPHPTTMLAMRTDMRLILCRVQPLHILRRKLRKTRRSHLPETCHKPRIKMRLIPPRIRHHRSMVSQLERVPRPQLRHRPNDSIDIIISGHAPSLPHQPPYQDSLNPSSTLTPHPQHSQ